MVSSVALFAFLQRVRSISLGRNLRAFILRCLLLWPRIVRNLRKFCPWYFQTSSSGEKKTKGDTGGPSSTETLRKREDCVVVCASRDLGGGGEPSRHSVLGSSDAEQSFPLDVAIPRTSSVPRSFSSSAPSLRGSPRLSATRLSPGGPHGSTSSLRTGSPHGALEFLTYRSNTPRSWSHSRAPLRQFIGESSRGHSRTSSPFRLPFTRPSTPARHDIETHQAPIFQSQGSPEGSTSEVSIQFERPSRPASPDDTESMYGSSRPRPPSPPPLHGPTQSLPTHHQLPSSESVNSSAVSSHSRGRSHSIQAPRIPFPQPSVPRATTPIPTTNAQDAQSRPDTLPVTPMDPNQVSRYMKKGDVLREMITFELPQMVVYLPHSYDFFSSGDWVPITHPEGALYFYHEAKRTFTDVYMYDPRLREEVHKSIEVLETRISELEYSGIHFPTENYDLVLDIVETEDKMTNRQYYYVDHNTKTLFWLEDYEISHALPGVKEPGHIKNLLESHYWTHWSLYPIGYTGRKFPNGASEEVLGVLLSNSIDALTSKASTAPYSVADMQTMSDIINKTKVLGPENTHAICSIARLLSICVGWKFIHFHGQKTSRLDRYRSIYKDSGHKRTKPFQLLSVILFFTPDVHLRELKKVWADKVVIEEVWKNFMQKLISEWIEFVLYSTVMLAGNVGFLAIQGVVVVPQKGWIIPSPAQIASSMSLAFSLGSIITGLLLIRRNRTMAIQEPGTTWEYLDGMTSRFFYLEPLAIVFSLTYALLMWSVCVFFVAVLLFSFKNETKGIRISVGVASGIVVVLIIWCIINCWDSSMGDSEREDLVVVLPECEKHVA